MPFCHTVHGPLEGRPGRLYEEVVSSRPEVKLISISMNQRKPKLGLPWIANCPNALDLSVYPFRRKSGGEYLALPRAHEPGQGRTSGTRGRARDGPAAEDRRQVPGAARDPLLRRVRPPAPRRVDRVRGRGRARRQGRAPAGRPRALCTRSTGRSRSACAIEAMACGTPVIATRRGAVPEILDHGRTGIIVDNYRDMEDPAVLEQADSLDPAEIRREVEERFSPEHMVADYVAAYEATIARLTARRRA